MGVDKSEREIARKMKRSKSAIHNVIIRKIELNKTNDLEEKRF